jgi:hypothetical protein
MARHPVVQTRKGHTAAIHCTKTLPDGPVNTDHPGTFDTSTRRGTKDMAKRVLAEGSAKGDFELMRHPGVNAKAGADVHGRDYSVPAKSVRARRLPAKPQY